MDNRINIVAAPASSANPLLVSVPPEPAEQKAPCTLFGVTCSSCLHLALLAFVAYSFLHTVYRVRHDPRDLAFVAGSYAVLGALFLCLRHAERLTPDSPAGERRRVHAAVWVLTTVLSLAFAYRVAALMPPALAVIVWAMTTIVVLAGLFMLVLCKGQHYQASDEVNCEAPFASDIKLFKKTKSTGELV
ncbi:hypothetical protein PR202_ga11472 [Eleusine coracana subsp. coracana]|uniref:Uncharacterized protein n=1 Tax=Eleusine coracana subsp. coracana TaxID=191504 RepID=A0AAV5C9B8_ELECO|nr:hypothetical protein PR202_ga11472 [Eleusine coracana subsp. coracana]